MILLNPIKDTFNSTTDATRWHANYTFALSLKKYIELKGDVCVISRKSEAAPMIDMESLVINYKPDIVIDIDCYTSSDKKAKGYCVTADCYSALVGTIVYELNRQGLKPIKETGYDISKSLINGTVADISIYLGHITNTEVVNSTVASSSDSTIDDTYDDVTTYNTPDTDYLLDDIKLDTIAKRVIEGSYGPPIKTIQDRDNVGNADPYFYTFDEWKEEVANEGCSGVYDNSTQEDINSIPIRFLKVNATTSQYYLGTSPDPADPAGASSSSSDDKEENMVPVDLAVVISKDITKPKPYLWCTPTLYTTMQHCMLMASVRATTPVDICLCIFNKVTTTYKVLARKADNSLVLVDGNVQYTTKDVEELVMIGTPYIEENFSSKDFTTLYTEVDVPKGSYVGIGILGTGKADFTSVWVTPTGSMATIDDPLTLYSINPPGYRTSLNKEPVEKGTNLLARAITDAKTLLDRAKDKEATEKAQATASTTSSTDSSTSINDILTMASIAVDFAAGLNNQLKSMGTLDPKKAPLVDIDDAVTKSSKLIKSLKTLTSSTTSISDKVKLILASVELNKIKNAAENAKVGPAEQESIAKQKGDLATKATNAKDAAANYTKPEGMSDKDYADSLAIKKKEAALAEKEATTYTSTQDKIAASSDVPAPSNKAEEQTKQASIRATERASALKELGEDSASISISAAQESVISKQKKDANIQDSLQRAREQLTTQTSTIGIGI